MSARLLRWLVVLLLASATWTARAEHHRCDEVIALDRAWRSVAQDGQQVAGGWVGAMDPLAREWRDEHTRIRYRVSVSECANRADRALWIYRIGAPYRAWLDGRPLVPIDPAALVEGHRSHVFNGRIPALFMLPQGARTLEVELATVPYVGSGLVRLLVGPQAELLDIRVLERHALTRSNNLISGLFGLVGLLVLLVWTMRRRDRGMLWFGLGCLAWSLRGLAYQAFVYPLPPLAMEQLNPLLVLTTVMCLAQSIRHGLVSSAPAEGLTARPLAASRADRWLALAYLGCVAGLALTLGLERGALPMRALCYLLAMAMLFVTLAQVVRRGWQVRQPEHALLALGLLVLIGGGLHDMGMALDLVTPSHWAFITPSFTVLLCCCTLVAALHLGRSLHRAETANEALAQAIAAKSAELERSYERLRESERESAQAQERARLSREMHDGLGAHLITALRGVERGAFRPDQVAQTLQDGLDELRLLLDSAQVGSSLLDALAAWRNRWDPRLGALGLTLHWRVDPAIEPLQLDNEAVLHVMRVLQEAVANAVKHAGQADVHVAAWRDGGPAPCLVLEIHDQGPGWPSGGPPARGSGLRNMARRAQQLGATLDIDPGGPGRGGVRVRLRLPWPSTD